MAISSSRWKTITESEFAWERAALNFIRDRLPDQEPYRAWSNFDFVAEDGSINEVDLVVLCPRGFFLIEIKSRPGVLDGDTHTWVWTHEGRQYTYDNPLLLANRKAKKLASLLSRQQVLKKTGRPFLEAVVYCSANGLKTKLEGAAAQGVYLSDQPAQPGIVALLTAAPPAEGHRLQIDQRLAKAVSQAMEQAGIRPSLKWRKVGDYLLEELLSEGPTYQDWLATHTALKKVQRRVHLYPASVGASKEIRERLIRAARREFEILEGIQHPGILRAVDYREHERGPALIFEHEPDSLRLDHFLTQYGERLGVDVRFDLLRQIADAIRYAHERKIVHRALSTQSVLVVDPESPSPQIKVFDWHTGYRDPGSGASTSQGITPTSHLGEMVEGAATAYLAPETLTNPHVAGEQADVFSLGAIAYHLFSGKRPAESQVELHEKLRDGKGLQISSVMDGAGKDLQFLIQFSTHPDLSSRIESVRDFIELLEDGVRKELIPREGEEAAAEKDLAELAPGDGLPFNLKIVKRLGRGGCSVTFLVERDGKESVLKIAADPKDNELLRSEAEALQKLRHHLIVELFHVYEYGDRVALHMAKAGDKTLGQRLREEGKLHVDLLQRLGDDLLQAVDWVEQQGIAHRDLKPDNLGVTPMGKDKQLHLILFDFSLTRTPAEKIRAGTRPYLDPFLSLRKPPRWDTYAERFAATMTLYEMATGTLPRWGDGKSDPALLDCEATLESELFEPNLREALTKFFAKALRRNYQERFDNAEEMLREWRRVFESLDRRTAPTEETDLENLEPALTEATLDTQLPLLPLSTRALNATERLNLTTVRDLLNLRLFELNSLPGVGNKTRREIGRVVGILAKRFPAEALAPKALKGPAPKAEAAAEEPFSVDRIAQLLLPAYRGGGRSSEEKILKDLLGLDEPAAGPSHWPSQTDVATALRITRARVGQILGKARERWSKMPVITQLRTEIAEIVNKNGGAISASELATAVLAIRGCARPEPARSRLAVAVARAAVETERALKEPALIVRRSGSRVLVAETQELADYAERLAKEADQLAEADPIAAPIRVVETLQKIRAPGERTLQAGRLVALAAAASANAAVSSRLEIYPRGLDPLRTLKLAQGALFGARELTVEEIGDRVYGRYPEAAPLPPRPKLDELLKEAGLEYEWSPSARGGEGAYQSRAKTVAQTTSGSASLTRLTTTDTLPKEITPEIAEARRFEEKLEWATKNGAFLTLTVPPKYLVRAEQELVRRFPVVRKSLEELVIRALKVAADKAKVAWNVVLRADGTSRDSQDWRNLMTLVQRAIPEVQNDLAATGKTLLLVHPGLLARYEQLNLLEWVRDQVTHRDGLQGAWVLVASDAQSELPKLDGHAVPVITRGQWERIPNGWLANRHRAGRSSGEAA